MEVTNNRVNIEAVRAALGLEKQASPAVGHVGRI